VNAQCSVYLLLLVWCGEVEGRRRFGGRCAGSTRASEREKNLFRLLQDSLAMHTGVL